MVPRHALRRTQADEAAAPVRLAWLADTRLAGCDSGSAYLARTMTASSATLPSIQRDVGLETGLSPTFGFAALEEAAMSRQPGPKTPLGGLYRVEESWREPGRSGFLVCWCRLVRLGEGGKPVPVDPEKLQQGAAPRELDSARRGRWALRRLRWGQQRVKNLVEIKGLTISVTDLESVAEFYEDLLGMREVRTASRERTYRFGEHELHLVLEENLEFPSRFGVLVDDIGELHVRAAAGNWIAKEGECDLVWTERDGSTRILLQDPSGNLIEAAQARS